MFCPKTLFSVWPILDFFLILLYQCQTQESHQRCFVSISFIISQIINVFFSSARFSCFFSQLFNVNPNSLVSSFKQFQMSNNGEARVMAYGLSEFPKFGADPTFPVLAVMPNLVDTMPVAPSKHLFTLFLSPVTRSQVSC